MFFTEKWIHRLENAVIKVVDYRGRLNDFHDPITIVSSKLN